MAEELCGQADRVLQRLPSTGIPRAQLAADTLGDARALDAGRAVATLILSAWRHPSTSSDSPIAIRGRDIWANAVVLVNELAQPALFLNLPVVSGEHEQPVGQPGYLSLRTLLRSPPCWEVAELEIYIYENPNLVAIAADHLGPIARR